MRRTNIHASYRDPSGFVFEKNGEIYRQVNPVYFDNYKLLIDSGLYSALAEQKLIVTHTEINKTLLKPLKIPVVSYAYEWCFSQLKDAALLTLQIQKLALVHGMSLKDATSFNVQFYNGTAIFIDTLSFEKYKAGIPWVAYKQFCEQFLCPLAIMSYTDTRISALLVSGVGTIPLDLTAKLLPFKARLNPMLLLHVFAQAGSQKKLNNLSIKEKRKNVSMSLNALKELINSLESAIKSLSLKQEATTWNSYYSERNRTNNYTEAAMEAKAVIVKKYLAKINPKLVLDIGANEGRFSKIASKVAGLVLSTDFDQAVVEQNYLRVKKNKEKNILPLIVDILKPSPSVGWDLNERPSFFDRVSPNTIMALALIHHLAIGNNLPFNLIADFFSKHCSYLIIEFVPKEDSQVVLLLKVREDIFPNYDQKNFELAFSEYFTIKERVKIKDSKRLLYLMATKK